MKLYVNVEWNSIIGIFCRLFLIHTVAWVEFDCWGWHNFTVYDVHRMSTLSCHQCPIKYFIWNFSHLNASQQQFLSLDDKWIKKINVHVARTSEQKKSWVSVILGMQINDWKGKIISNNFCVSLCINVNYLPDFSIFHRHHRVVVVVENFVIFAYSFIMLCMEKNMISIIMQCIHDEEMREN